MSIPSARSFFFPEAGLSPAAELAREMAFFRHLRMPNGTYKTTYANRMPDVDAAAADALGSPRAIRVLDVGVSSGVTTLELAEVLDGRGFATTVDAVDLSVAGYLHRVVGVDLLTDSDGRVVQIATPLLVKGRPHDPAGSIARRGLQSVFALTERLIGGPEGTRRGTPVRIVSPRLLRRPGVTVAAHDLTGSAEPAWAGAFDLVRAANVINRDYFDEPTLTRMLANVITYLRPLGVLVLCRTHDDTRTNHATLFRRDAAGAMAVVGRIGQGSEVEALVR